MKLDDHTVIAGAELCKNLEPYAVLSCYYDDLKDASCRQGLIRIVNDMLDVLDADTRILVVRTPLSYVQYREQKQRLESRVSPRAAQLGVSVRFFKSSLPPHPYMLADDAAKRKGTIITRL